MALPWGYYGVALLKGYFRVTLSMEKSILILY